MRLSQAASTPIRRSIEMTTIAPAPNRPRVAPRVAPRTARFVIGRQPDSDFVIDERTVSRRHATLRRAENGWLLEDLGSLNGTRVNGKRVVTRASVTPGDVLGFGAATARFDPDERRLFSELRVEDPTGET
jgi:pSer/pThr/pTyr-binding forkhead associated (FHA) protein